MTTITVLRSNMIVFCLDEAIDWAFDKPTEVEKDGLVGLPFGTVIVDGKAWDWVKSHDRYRFTPAE